MEQKSASEAAAYEEAIRLAELLCPPHRSPPPTSEFLTSFVRRKLVPSEATEELEFPERRGNDTDAACASSLLHLGGNSRTLFLF